MIAPYTGLITSEHASKQNFSALVAALTQPIADATALANSMITLFDVDTAVGQQLDYIGQWVGITRTMQVAITNVFWSLDIPPGLDQGIVWNQFTPTSGVQQLPDDQYRTVLRAKILNNQWDGSMAQAYAISNSLFLNTGYVPFIQDNGDLTMFIGISGKIPDALTMAMLTHGMLDVRPAGVQVAGYITPSAAIQVPQNLATNPGFESGDAIWIKEDNWRIVNDLANSRNGNWCAERTTPTIYAAVKLPAISCTAGQQYTLSGWIKFSAGSNGTGAVRMLTYTSGGTLVDTFSGNSVTANTYTQSTVTGTISATAVKIYMEFVCAGFTVGTMYCDDASYTQVGGGPLTSVATIAAFDIENAAFGGADIGSIAVYTAPS